MCEQPSCGNKSKKLMNKLTNEPDTHEFIVIEWRYTYSQPTPNYSGGYATAGTTTYSYTLAPSTSGIPTNQTTSGTPAHYQFPPLEGSINIPQNARLEFITAVRVMCVRCGFIKIL